MHLLLMPYPCSLEPTPRNPEKTCFTFLFFIL
jgi:hypothetical protein